MTDANQRHATALRAYGVRPEAALRFLFAVPTQWTPTLGQPRVSIEISERLSAMGHHCEKFAMEDAFPGGLGRVRRFFSRALFQRRFRDHLRRHGSRYDVVQAECEVLPFARDSYGFKGVLISKSNGLPQIYRQYLEQGVLPKLRRVSGEYGTSVGNTMRWLGRYAAGGDEAIKRGFRTADQIHLLNEDEMRFVSRIPGCQHKSVLITNGLSTHRAAELAASATPMERATSNTVAYVGTWALRKGKVEFPSLVRRVRAERPATRFALLGTYAPDEEVLAAFDPKDRDHVHPRSKFDPDELPALLTDARCGVFPSHVEGFGLGVLEMLGAGIPVVAWDVPGPPEMLSGPEPGGVLAPAGDIEQTARELLRLLDTEEYLAESEAALKRSQRFRWDDITDQFLSAVGERVCA